MFNKIKYYIQRAKRGYADSDLWDFDDYLCGILPAALRKMKGGVGCPSEFFDESAKNNECHNWDDELETMAQGFEAAKFLKDYKFIKWVPSKENKEGMPGTNVMTTDYEAMENARKKVEKGLESFAKNFLNLWD